MKSIRNVMILWTPESYADMYPETIGKAALLAHPDVTKESGRYAYSDGACYSAVREEFNDSELARYTLATALAMIVRDGIDPLEVHKVLSELIEYRENTPVDMPG